MFTPGWVVLGNFWNQNKVRTRHDRKNTILGSEDLSCAASSTLGQTPQHLSIPLLPQKTKSGAREPHGPSQAKCTWSGRPGPLPVTHKASGHRVAVRVAELASPDPQGRHGQVLQCHLLWLSSAWPVPSFTCPYAGGMGALGRRLRNDQREW